MCICKSSNSAIKNYVVFRIQDVLVMDTINANIINKATHLCYHFSSIHANVGFFFFFNLSLEQSFHPQDNNESMTHPKRTGIIFKVRQHHQESPC